MAINTETNSKRLPNPRRQTVSPSPLRRVRGNGTGHYLVSACPPKLPAKADPTPHPTPHQHSNTPSNTPHQHTPTPRFYWGSMKTTKFPTPPSNTCANSVRVRTTNPPTAIPKPARQPCFPSMRSLRSLRLNVLAQRSHESHLCHPVPSVVKLFAPVFRAGGFRLLGVVRDPDPSLPVPQCDHYVLCGCNSRSRSFPAVAADCLALSRPTPLPTPPSNTRQHSNT